MISWIILTKLENKSIAKKGKSILSAKEKKLPPKKKVQAKKVNESKNNYRSKGYISPNKRKKKKKKKKKNR